MIGALGCPLLAWPEHAPLDKMGLFRKVLQPRGIAAGKTHQIGRCSLLRHAAVGMHAIAAVESSRTCVNRGSLRRTTRFRSYLSGLRAFDYRVRPAIPGQLPASAKSHVLDTMRMKGHETHTALVPYGGIDNTQRALRS